MYVFNLVISKMSAEIQPDALKKPQDVGLLILVKKCKNFWVNPLIFSLRFCPFPPHKIGNDN